MKGGGGVVSPRIGIELMQWRTSGRLEEVKRVEIIAGIRELWLS
jgi:hypothetical protein